MEKKDKTISILITFGVLFLLGAVFISVLSDQTLTTTQKTTVTDESYNLTALSCYVSGTVNESAPGCILTTTYAPTSWKQEDCPLTSVVVSNSAGTALTLDTDYSVAASTGVVSMLNTTSTNSTNLGETVLIDYSYCGDNYMNSSWGRSLLGVNAGLLAVALLAAGAGLVYLLYGRKFDDD